MVHLRRSRCPAGLGHYNSVGIPPQLTVALRRHRSRRCWRLAAPTGSASGMGVTDLDLDPVSRMSESSGSYARVFCMLATASGSPKRTANHGRPVRIAAEISHLIASFRLVGPRIWMGPAFGRR